MLARACREAVARSLDGAFASLGRGFAANSSPVLDSALKLSGIQPLSQSLGYRVVTRNCGHTHSSPRPLSAQSVSSMFGVSFARDGGRLLNNQQTSGNQRRLPDMAAFVRRNMSTKGKFESLSDGDKRRLLAAARLRAQSQANASSNNAAYYLFALVVGMVGLTYASVPLYRMFCQATGYGGTTRRVKGVEEKLLEAEEMDEATTLIVAGRRIKITFNSDVADGMQWKFSPCQREVHCVPGQTVLAFFRAQNLSEAAITGVSTYNVTPMKAGPYFNKIQCFCFEEQRLQAGEEVDMPVFFYVDPEFALDPKMKGLDTLTLSYTFFKVDEEKGDLIAQATAQAAAANVPTMQMNVATSQ